MSAYKQFNTQDLIISPFEVNKGFYFIGGEILTGSNVGIDRYIGTKGDYFVKSFCIGLDNLATANKSFPSLYKPTVVGKV